MSRRTFHDWFTARGIARNRHYLGGKQFPPPHRRPLRFEPLEDRRMLTITVNTLVDENDGIAIGGISLREAIAAAADHEIISFDTSLVAAGPATISLTHGELLVNKPLSISGPGANLLTIDASASDPTPNENNGDGHRVFRFDDGNNASLAVVGLFGLTITGGDTLGDGGGIYNRESFSMADCVVTGNAADDGGGMYTRIGYMTLTRVTIRDNAALDDGGAIANSFGRVTIQDSTLSGNVAGDDAGGIFNFSDLGGFHNLAIKNSTVSGNTSSGYGGGVFNFSGIATIEFSTITDNTAPVALGGGVATWGDTNTTRTDVRSSIIAGNHSDDVVHLTGAPLPANTFNSLGHNLIGSGTSLAKFNQVGDQTNVADPRLAPLGDYGGPTQTHALLLHSPAIDAGNPTAFAGVNGVPSNDQRGVGRIEDGDGVGGARLDIGSFENHAFYFLVDEQSDESDGDFGIGDLSLREAIALSNASTSQDWIIFDASLAGQSISLSLGELTITDDVVIDATALTLGVTIDAGGNDLTPGVEDGLGTRVLVVDDGDEFESNVVTLRGLTLTGADSSGSGGAIYSQEALTVADCNLTGNSAQWGGGIYNAPYGNLILERSTISGNSAIAPIPEAIGSGGGIYNWGGNVTVQNSTISGNDSVSHAGGIRNANGGYLFVVRSSISDNVAAGEGGGIRNDDGNVEIADSTISDNEADKGGGMFVATPNFQHTNISNSTISGNTALLGAGGLYNQSGHVLFEFSTITQNVSFDFAGSGVASAPSPVDAPTTFYSSIIAANFDPNAAPQSAPYDVAVSGAFNSLISLGYNIVGIGGFVNDTFSQPGDQIIGTDDPLLGPLANNGGSTFTHALVAGSPAIDAGDPTAVAGIDDVPAFDQRGSGFDRVRDGDAAEGVAVDVGAFEVQQFVAGPALPGDYNLDETVDAADYTIWRDTLGQELSLFEGADGDGDGTIDPDDYDVWKANFGNTLPGLGGAAFAGGASGGGPILVTTLADVIDFGDGLTSLREAIFAANVIGGPDTIEFAASLTAGGPATILLTLGQLAITDSLTINGPGANLLTIDASGNDLTPDSTLSDGDDTNDGDGSRIFDIDDGNAASAIEVAISGLALTGADAGGYGGAIQTRETLTVREASISDNFSFGGGGIYAHLRPLVVENSTISGNAAVNGGGIFGTEITIASSTISGNTAFSRGGGILSYIGELRLAHSTVTGNRTETSDDAGHGGGIFRYLGQQTVLDHTIVANNLNAGILPDDLVADVTARFSLIGNGTGLTIVDEGGNLIGTSEALLDPLLAPLADNGGPTWTHALRPLSPALDAGDPAAVAGADGVPEFDQRGNPFTRVFDIDGVGGPRIDIGAYEAAPFTLVVDTLADELDGDYSPGDFSLREALELSNTRAGHDTIEFSPALTAGGPAAIVLTMGELAITDAVTINGPSAELLTVDASGNDLNPDVFGDGSRIFKIDNNNSGISIGVEIRGLTLTGGDSAQGGAILSRESLFGELLVVTGNQATIGGALAILNFGGITTIADSMVVQNKASSQGGAFFVQASTTGIVTIRNNTISANMANRGGALYVAPGSTTSVLTITDNSIADNSALQQGGAIYITSPSVPKTTIRSSTLSGNSAGQQGGAVFVTLSRDIAIVDSSIVNNKSLAANQSQGRGGGIYTNMGDVAITGSTISGNMAAAGGGVHSHNGELLINSSSITNNSATAGDGGGIYSGGDRLSIVGSTISGNTATGIFSQAGRGGGLWHAVGSLAPTSILDSVFANNSATNYGGGADFRATSEGLGSTLTLTNVDFTGNMSSRGGGFAFALGGQGSSTGSLVINNGSVTGNSASMNGGGIYGGTALLQVSGTTISGNQASGNGGGISTSQAGRLLMTMSLVDSTITQNSAGSSPNSGNGGGIWISSGTVSLTMLDTEVSHNSARQGGGISRSGQAIAGTMSAVGSTISGNTATIHGGGIYNVASGALSFTRTVVAGNVVGVTVPGPIAHGGGIFNRQADLLFVNSSLTGNSSLNGRGGGLYHNGGDVSVTGSTISGNFARQDGGGVWTFASPSTDRLNFLSSTISGNSSLQGTGGLRLQGTSTIRHSTITGNSTQGFSFAAGGVSAGDNSQFELDHSIIARNISTGAAAPDLVAQFAPNLVVRFSLIGSNQGTSLVEAQLGSPDASGNLIGKPVASGGSGVINPLLGLLTQNGGQTRTHALLPGSPALDTGALITGPPQGFDQRGNPFSRMVDGTGDGVVHIDMGAYESQGVPSFSPGDYNRNGVVDAADYTVWRNSAGAFVMPFELADGDGDGMVDADDYALWMSHFGAGLTFTLGGGGGAIAVAPGPLAPELSAAALAFASQLPARPGDGAVATNPFAKSLPADAVREQDALVAWLAAQPCGSSANDDAFARDADETTPSDTDSDPIEAAIHSVFAAFGV